MSNEIVTQQHSNAIATIDENIDDGLTSADLEIPQLRLLQALSKSCTDGNARPGQYENSLSGEIYDANFDVIIIRKFQSAVYFKEKRMLCKSKDGVTSVSGNLCIKCPFGAYWGDWVDDKPPACNKVVNFIVVPKASLDNGEFNPMIMSMMKDALKETRPVIKKMAYEKMVKKLPIYHQFYTIGCYKKDNPKGVYFAPTFKNSTVLTADQLKAAKEISAFLASKKENIKLHDEEEAGEASFDTNSFDEV